MLQLADEAFCVKSDPDQLDVTQKMLDRLMKIHSAKVSK